LGCISNSNDVICVDSYSTKHISINSIKKKKFLNSIFFKKSFIEKKVNGTTNWIYNSDNISNSVGWMDGNGDALIVSPFSMDQTLVLLISNGTVGWKIAGGAKYDTLFTQIGMFVISTSYGGLLSVKVFLFLFINPIFYFLFYFR
jgi:hypothetical protein